MIVGDWDFSKLPEQEYCKIIEAMFYNDIGTLVWAHDRYRLSTFSAYCCHGNGHLTIKYYRIAIEKGYIKNNE